MPMIGKFKYITSITGGGSNVILPSAIDRGRTRSSWEVYNGTIYTLYLSFSADCSNSNYDLAVAPNSLYAEDENAHGYVYQGAIFGAIDTTSTVRALEELYSG